MSRSLRAAIDRVVSSGNCIGCGACTTLDPGLTMEMGDDGFLRPVASDASPPGSQRVNRDVRNTFRAICPGKRVHLPRDEGTILHPVFGVYRSAWNGWATDDAIRRSGSSGGVLTALSSWMIASGEFSEIVGAAGNTQNPRTTVPVRITSRDEAIAASGSRYSPVAGGQLSIGDARSGAVGKPCEIAARRSIGTRSGAPRDSQPVLLSFFCAGTPSQIATDSLVQELGVNPDRLTKLRYRGDGWPGHFVVEDDAGNMGRLSYDKSWGRHLGRQLHPRCKICPDGTGETADISVGDYWRADKDGYPSFENADGQSVVIARTARGENLLRRAHAAHVISIEPLSLDLVADVQPLQVRRIAEVLARLAGRRLAGRRVPRYSGLRLWRRRSKSPTALLRATAGSFLRAARSR
jgi:coenzyme F420 hydrogenase subunit beta